MAPVSFLSRLRQAPRPLTGLTAALLLAGCGPAPAALSGGSTKVLPLPPGIRVAFNHRGEGRYRSPISGQWRQGDDLEALVLESIREARRQILVAVQELSLQAVAEALAERHRRGVRVRVVLENLYSAPWSQQHPVDLPPINASASNSWRPSARGTPSPCCRGPAFPCSTTRPTAAAAAA